ncbi:MAG: glycosyltransferase [Pseudomonadota bacterium]
MTRKVFIAISNFEYGGAQRQIVELANNMDPARYEVHVCSLSDYVPLAENLTIPKSNFHIVQKKSKYDLSVATRLAQLFTELKPDIVQGYLFDANIAVRLAGRRAKVPVVLDSERNADYILKTIHKVVYRLTRRMRDACIANSEAGARFNAKIHASDGSEQRVVHNGVDSQRFRPADASADRESLGYKPEHFVVGMFGSIKYQKNHPALFRAASRIMKDHRQVRFLFVGDQLHAGMHGSADYKTEMEAMIDSLGIRPVSQFLGNRDDVETLYRCCDVTVLPSYFEGTPNVLLESMACGVPILATTVSDNAIIAPNGKVGQLFEINDDDALVSGLEKMAGDLEYTRQLGKNAREWIEAEYSSSRLAEKTADVYDALLKGGD